MPAKSWVVPNLQQLTSKKRSAPCVESCFFLPFSKSSSKWAIAIAIAWPSGFGLGFSSGCFFHSLPCAENVLLHCLAVMNSTVYYAKNPMTVWHSKLSSSPRQGNETKSTDQMTIQDVLSRLKAKKVLSKSAHDFQLFESHENSYH